MDVSSDRVAPSVLFVVVRNSVCSLWEGRGPLHRIPGIKILGELTHERTSVPSPPQACLVFLSNGQECAGRGQPGPRPQAQAAPVTVPGWPFTPELSRLLLLSSKMFQYVELWGRDREKNRDIVEKEIMNNPAASLHTPHVGRSG